MVVDLLEFMQRWGLLGSVILHIVQQRYGWMEYMPLTQKIVVYYMIAWFIVLAFNFRLENRNSASLNPQLVDLD